MKRAIEKRDAEAKGAFAAMDDQRSMERCDRESRIFQTTDKMHEELHFDRQERETRAGTETCIPSPKFKCGESVLQWWAAWMKTAETMPTHFGKTKRPAWFSVEVCSFHKWGTIRYAGQEVTANLYNVFDWNGSRGGA